MISWTSFIAYCLSTLVGGCSNIADSYTKGRDTNLLLDVRLSTLTRFSRFRFTSVHPKYSRALELTPSCAPTERKFFARRYLSFFRLYYCYFSLSRIGLEATRLAGTGPSGLDTRSMCLSNWLFSSSSLLLISRIGFSSCFCEVGSSVFQLLARLFLLSLSFKASSVELRLLHKGANGYNPYLRTDLYTLFAFSLP